MSESAPRATSSSPVPVPPSHARRLPHPDRFKHRSVRARLAHIALMCVLIGLWLGPGAAAHDADPQRWEDHIQAFEAADRRSPPRMGGVLFVGSSSIRGWDLDRWFPDRNAINRGFGGSTIPDVNHYIDRIVLPYRPRTIVFYAGDNDVAAGHSPQQVAEDYRRFTQRVHDALPETRIIFVAIKPSTARWELAEEMRRANKLVREHTEDDPRLAFADIWNPMLGDNGRPRAELLADDGLHLTEDGYRLWTRIIRSVLNPEKTAEE